MVGGHLQDGDLFHLNGTGLANLDPQASVKSGHTVHAETRGTKFGYISGTALLM